MVTCSLFFDLSVDHTPYDLGIPTQKRCDRLWPGSAGRSANAWNIPICLSFRRI